MYALDAQLDLYQWFKSNSGFAAIALGMIKDGVGSGDGGAYQRDALLDLLAYGETFHVEKEWAKFLLVAQAELTELEPHPILVGPDLMALKGFAYFEEPMMVQLIPQDIKDSGEQYAPIRAIAWTVSNSVMRPESRKDPTLRPGMGAVIWAFTDPEWYLQFDDNPELTESTSFKSLPLYPYDVTGWSFDTPWEEIDSYTHRPPFTVDPSAASWRRGMYAFWHLLSSYVFPIKASRGARRRWEREFPNLTKPDYGTIKHVTLRRAQQTSGTRQGSGMGEREYSHRFMVRGHWRKQWYPSIEAHKPIWINPHVRGPEDKPLIIKDRVFDVKR